MEVDIEICLNNVTRDEASSLEKQFLVKGSKEDVNICQEITIRQDADNRIGVVDHIIRDFLSNLALFSETIKQHHGVLRLGVFYNADESVVFPFRLSYETIKSMADLNLSIDATGYPCSPGE